MKDAHYTYGGKNNDDHLAFYKDLPDDVLSKLDQRIRKRAVHFGSEFSNAALKGGYDPEKVSWQTLKSEGLINLNRVY